MFYRARIEKEESGNAETGKESERVSLFYLYLFCATPSIFYLHLFTLICRNWDDVMKPIPASDSEDDKEMDETAEPLAKKR